MYLQQFYLNINYKKGNINNVAYCLSQPPIVVLTTILNSCGKKTYEWPQLYNNDPNFIATYQTLGTRKKVPKFHLQDALLCYMGHLCVPSSDHEKIIWESLYNWVACHFSVENTVEII